MKKRKKKSRKKRPNKVNNNMSDILDKYRENIENTQFRKRELDDMLNEEGVFGTYSAHQFQQKPTWGSMLGAAGRWAQRKVTGGKSGNDPRINAFFQTAQNYRDMSSIEDKKFYKDQLRQQYAEIINQVYGGNLQYAPPQVAQQLRGTVIQIDQDYQKLQKKQETGKSKKQKDQEGQKFVNQLQRLYKTYKETGDKEYVSEFLRTYNATAQNVSNAWLKEVSAWHQEMLTKAREIRKKRKTRKQQPQQQPETQPTKVTDQYGSPYQTEKKSTNLNTRF